MLKRLYRCILVELIDGEKILLNEEKTNKLFDSYTLSHPTMIPPVLSLQFREAVNKYGITFVDLDEESIGMIRYIPPSQLKSLEFYLSTKEIDNEYFKDKMKNVLYG